MENSCPQCKAKITKISYRDILGRLKYEKIEDKAQEIDNFEDVHCEECNERVYERNFDARNRDRDTAAICEECLEKAIHLRCMPEVEREMWEYDRIWYCQECFDALSDSYGSYGDFDSENGLAEISRSMLGL